MAERVSSDPEQTAVDAKRPLPSRLGIVAAGGTIPFAVCEAAQKNGIEVHVIAIKGVADPAIERFPHSWVRLGELGSLLNSLKSAKCSDIVIIGAIKRPELWNIGVDFGFIWHLPTILSLTRGGDDSLLKRVVKFFESQGFTVRGAYEIAPELLAPSGSFGRISPTDENHHDIRRGFALLEALSPFDVGQSTVVSRGHVLAVEAAEGTDEMLKRCKTLQQWGGRKRSGVLVKAPKSEQELRVDMPAIGPRTIEFAARAGLAGIAVASGRVMIANQAEMIALADRHELFVAGVEF